MGKPAAGFSQQTMELLQGYAWPGTCASFRTKCKARDSDRAGGVRDARSAVTPCAAGRGDDRAGEPAKGTLKEMKDQVERCSSSRRSVSMKQQDGSRAWLGITRRGPRAPRLRALELRGSTYQVRDVGRTPGRPEVANGAPVRGSMASGHIEERAGERTLDEARMRHGERGVAMMRPRTHRISRSMVRAPQRARRRIRPPAARRRGARAEAPGPWPQPRAYRGFR